MWWKKWRKRAETQERQAETEHLRVSFPDYFVELSDSGIDGVDLILAMGKSKKGSFRPNLVFTSVEDSSPLVDAATAGYRAVFAEHPGARLFTVDGWRGINQPPLGRSFRFTYPLAGMDVMVKKWVVATGQHHLHFTASYLPSQTQLIEDVFDWMVDNVVLKAPLEQVEAAAVGESQHGVRLDEVATKRVKNFLLEDLSWVENPDPLSGELMDDEEFTREFVETPSLGPFLMRIEVYRGDYAGQYTAHWGSYGVEIIRSAGKNAFEPLEGKYTAYQLDPENLLSDALAWINLRPSFAFADNVQLSLDEFNQKLSKGQSEPWTAFTIVQADELVFRCAYVPGKGMYNVEVLDSQTLKVGPIPPAIILGMTAQIIDVGFQNLV